MRSGTRHGRLALLIVAGGFWSLAAMRADARQTTNSRSNPNPPAAKQPTQPAASQKQAPSPSPSMEFVPARTKHPEQVIATVNGDPITRGEIFKVMMHYFIPPGNEKQAYDIAVKAAVNHRLLVQHVTRAGIKVTDKEIDDDIAILERELKEHGDDIASYMAGNDVSMDDLRRQGRNILMFNKFLDARSSDKALKDFVAKHPDVYKRVKIRAAHIFLKVEPEATTAEKAKIRARLATIKRDIDAKKISFADAANKYSEDEVNVEKHVGGDIGEFAHNQFNKKFEDAAFALKPGMISDPVETEFGYHLIVVTGRKEGEPVKLEEAREQILEHFKQDLEDQILEQEMKIAKIKIEPMPKDFFPQPNKPATNLATPKSDPGSIKTKGAGAPTSPATPPKRR